MTMKIGEPKVCCDCSKEFARLADDTRCWSCYDAHESAKARTEAAAKTIENISAEVDARLRFAGLQPRELQARRESVPDGIRRLLPRDPVAAMRDGLIPANGWGMIGTTGIGKTMAIAALLRVWAEAVIRRRAPEEGEVSDNIGLAWVSWPSEADYMRVHGTETRLLHQRVKRLSESPILVLDDLARERRKGAYSEDWAVGKLDLIIDERSRRMLPTIWTSNVDEKALIGIYGAALVSRLIGENPAVTLSGHDLRLSPKMPSTQSP